METYTWLLYIEGHGVITYTRTLEYPPDMPAAYGRMGPFSSLREANAKRPLMESWATEHEATKGNQLAKAGGNNGTDL